MTATDDAVLHYDPYDFDIDSDPYPMWSRLRNEAPLYFNDRYDFFALSRYADVERASLDWSTYSSARGTVLEVIKSGMQVPPGMFIFEDPPLHDAHRSVLSRVFTPRRVAALESQVRELCSRSLDRHLGDEVFDYVDAIARFVPMRVIGMLLGIPEHDLDTISDDIQKRHHLEEARPTAGDYDTSDTMALFSEYLDWRKHHPSDDLMSGLLTTEIDDDTGVRRLLTRDEVLTCCRLLASAGNETTQRLLGWIGKVMADHSAARREVADDRALIPNAIEEVLRYESPSPVQARATTAAVELYGQVVPAGSPVLLLTGSANRDERHFADPDRFDIHRAIDRHLSFGYGVHFCVGAALARLEARVALDEMLQRWRDWEVADGAVLDHTSTTRGWLSLPLRIG